ncbi:hypothetical protein SNEBB_004976 [Seison nebaliae]|nr:hypothetical protein SNEBB_004976 [Seison nebaliae]
MMDDISGKRTMKESHKKKRLMIEYKQQSIFSKDHRIRFSRTTKISSHFLKIEFDRLFQRSNISHYQSFLMKLLLKMRRFENDEYELLLRLLIDANLRTSPIRRFIVDKVPRIITSLRNNDQQLHSNFISLCIRTFCLYVGEIYHRQLQEKLMTFQKNIFSMTIEEKLEELTNLSKFSHSIERYPIPQMSMQYLTTYMIIMVHHLYILHIRYYDRILDESKIFQNYKDLYYSYLLRQQDLLMDQWKTYKSINLKSEEKLVKKYMEGLDINLVPKQSNIHYWMLQRPNHFHYTSHPITYADESVFLFNDVCDELLLKNLYKKSEWNQMLDVMNNRLLVTNGKSMHLNTVVYEFLSFLITKQLPFQSIEKINEIRANNNFVLAILNQHYRTSSISDYLKIIRALTNENNITNLSIILFLSYKFLEEFADDKSSYELSLHLIVLRGNFTNLLKSNKKIYRNYSIIKMLERFINHCEEYKRVSCFIEDNRLSIYHRTNFLGYSLICCNFLSFELKNEEKNGFVALLMELTNKSYPEQLIKLIILFLFNAQISGNDVYSFHLLNYMEKEDNEENVLDYSKLMDGELETFEMR